MVKGQSRKGQQAQRKLPRKWGLRDRFPSLNMKYCLFSPLCANRGACSHHGHGITSGKISTLNPCVPT